MPPPRSCWKLHLAESFDGASETVGVVRHKAGGSTSLLPASQRVRTSAAFSCFSCFWHLSCLLALALSCLLACLLAGGYGGEPPGPNANRSATVCLNGPFRGCSWACSQCVCGPNPKNTPRSLSISCAPTAPGSFRRKSVYIYIMYTMYTSYIHHTYILHTYMHTCIHAYMHTCIHAYIHAYIHA